MRGGTIKHASVVALLALCALASAGQAQEPAQTIYKYKNGSGRTVYTNDVEQVPLRVRDSGRVDLSHVSLNTEAGNAIAAEHTRRAAAVASKHAELTGSSYCRALKDEAAMPLIERIWHDHAPLVVCGALALLLVFLTPRMLRSVGAPVWAKVLTKAIPALALAGGAMYGMTHANRTASEIKIKLAPCLSETFAKLGESPEGMAKREHLVEKLERDIAGMHKAATDRAGQLADFVKN
jgi:hypothetical protein